MSNFQDGTPQRAPSGEFKFDFFLLYKCNGRYIYILGNKNLDKKSREG